MQNLFRSTFVSTANVPVYPGFREIPETDPSVPSRSLGTDWNYLFEGPVSQDKLDQVVAFYDNLYPDAKKHDWSDNSGMYYGLTGAGKAGRLASLELTNGRPVILGVIPRMFNCSVREPWI